MEDLPLLQNFTFTSRITIFCTGKCVCNKYLYLSHSTFFSSPRGYRDFIDIHWHKHSGHASAPLINCQLKSMELFKKSCYRVLPIRGLIHFPVSDCNIVTVFRDHRIERKNVNNRCFFKKKTQTPVRRLWKFTKFKTSAREESILTCETVPVLLTHKYIFAQIINCSSKSTKRMTTHLSLDLRLFQALKLFVTNHTCPRCHTCSSYVYTM